MYHKQIHSKLSFNAGWEQHGHRDLCKMRMIFSVAKDSSKIYSSPPAVPFVILWYHKAINTLIPAGVQPLLIAEANIQDDTPSERTNKHPVIWQALPRELTL